MHLIEERTKFQKIMLLIMAAMIVVFGIITGIQQTRKGILLRQDFLLRQEVTNIILIGMPGCGKTSVGQALAALTGREAIDLDQRIVEKAGRSIPEIFALEGEAVFRALEREVTAEVG